MEGAGGGARGRSQGTYVLFRRGTIWKAIGVFMSPAQNSSEITFRSILSQFIFQDDFDLD